MSNLDEHTEFTSGFI